MMNACGHGFAVIALLTIAAAASAHDFWLEPRSFWITEFSAAAVTLRVGEGEDRQRSRISADRIVRFDAIAPDASAADLRNELRSRALTHDARVQAHRRGTYVLAFESDDRARSYLPASAFNAYLQREGLTSALELRSRTGRMKFGGAEKYSRCAKALLQVGAPAASPQATAPVGLTLEIVPEVNPYATPRPAALPLRVLYEGRALAGALVKLISLDRAGVPIEARVTDERGRVSFATPANGAWILSVVWTKPLTTDEVDFATTFSTLSFGFEDDHAQPS